jgi:hypothetical protein
VTYAGKGRWAYLVVLVVMVVILLNAESCAELILRNKHVVNGQNLSYYHAGYYLPEELDQENKTVIALP